MSDYMVRATAAEGQIRIFAVTAKDLVESAKNHHNTSPVMTAALGRLLMGGVMMGAMMKGEKDILTIQIQCSGPAKGLMVTSDAQGHVKGYPFVNDVILPANDKGKLDVGHALDLGVMSVIKDIGMKEPYVGQVALQTGEIGDDLTYYFATSEQIPSSVGLGVLMNKDNTVRAAGGFILQLMPFAKEELIDDIEKKIESLQSVTSLIEKGETPEELLGAVLKGIEFEVTDTLPVEFRCDCSKERILKSLATLPGKDLDDLISGIQRFLPRIVLTYPCQFCNTAYQFETEDLKEIRS